MKVRYFCNICCEVYYRNLEKCSRCGNKGLVEVTTLSAGVDVRSPFFTARGEKLR